MIIKRNTFSSVNAIENNIKQIIILTVRNKKKHVGQNFSFFRRLFALRPFDLFFAVASEHDDAAVGQGVHAERISSIKTCSPCNM